MVDAVSERRNGTEPITTPTTTPAPTAMASPSAQAKRVSRRATQNALSPNSLTRARPISLDGGR